MGGSFGGMMMRHAMALNGSNSYRYTTPRAEKTWAEKVLDSTEGTLEKIKDRRDLTRDLAVDQYEAALRENSQVLAVAGLLKKGDTLYKVLCRAAGVKYRKKDKKNVR